MEIKDLGFIVEASITYESSLLSPDDNQKREIIEETGVYFVIAASKEEVTERLKRLSKIKDSSRKLSLNIEEAKVHGQGDYKGIYQIK